jgi:hypothetical protein
MWKRKRWIVFLLTISLLSVAFFFFKKTSSIQKHIESGCYPFPSKIDHFNCALLIKGNVTTGNRSYFCTAGSNIFTAKKYWEAIYFVNNSNSSLMFSFGIPIDKKTAGECFKKFNITLPSSMQYEEISIGKYRGIFIEEMAKRRTVTFYLRRIAFLDENNNYLMLVNKVTNQSELLDKERMKNLILEFKKYTERLVREG